MKQLSGFIALFLFVLPLWVKAQSAYYDVRKGNEKYVENDYQAAEELFRESIRKDPKPLESAYNLGNALYRQGKYEEAVNYFSAAAKKAEEGETKARAYHNLGNALLKNQKLEESIEAYKKALLNNPKDEESRYNLAYAQQQLKQEQQQQQQEDQKQDQKEQQEQEEQEKQEQQEQQQEENQEEQKEQEQNQNEQEQKEEEQQQQEQQQQQQVSREDAERILEALNEKEKEVQEKLKKKKGKAVKIDIEKDW
jgi:tetratricopeptide (TPR) repeat protein